MMHNGIWTTWAVALAGLTASFCGCYPDDPCPEGQEAIRGVCVSPDSDGGTDGGDIVQCEPTGEYDAFGIDCEEQSECACPAGTCNTDLGNYCTELNCMRTDDDGGMLQVCPPGWTCQSVEGFPGVPPGVDSICVRP